jgi:uncharacterized protein YecT (DUF1311 family)
MRLIPIMGSLGTVFLMLMSSAARAQDPDPCLQNQATLNECAEEAAAKDEAQMNSAYRGAIEAVRSHEFTPLNPEQMVKSLMAAQEAWLKSRDATCAFDAALLGGGGSMGGLEHSHCLNSLNIRRAIAFQKLTECLKAPECKFPVGLHQFQIRLDASNLHWE